MTPQEALLEIRNKAFRNTDDYEIKISKNCYKEIITALEKQIPKETVPTSDNVFEFGNCPNCGKEFNSELIGEYEITHCPYCGQALDLG